MNCCKTNINIEDPIKSEDLFLKVFSNDFCKIIKTINFKRKVRGRDDPLKLKI